MTIRRCSGCAQLVHFSPASPLPSCWNCGIRCDLARPDALGRALSLLPEMPLLSQGLGVARLALVAAAPIAVLMLLLSGSFDIHVVSDFGASLLRTPSAEGLQMGCFGL